MKPKRIQCKRTKGWRMPEGAVYVGRPSVWGNRYRVANPPRELGDVPTPQQAVDGFRRMWAQPHQRAFIQEKLRGHDLACWCPLDQACHADVLLEIAND
jgi:hypothetical protein